MSKISEAVADTFAGTSSRNNEVPSIDSLIENSIELKEKSIRVNHELVNHPEHYQSKTGLEAIDVIEAFDLGFNLGNVVKYVLRCGKKDAAVQELEKAKWYLEREINLRKN